MFTLTALVKRSSESVLVSGGSFLDILQKRQEWSETAAEQLVCSTWEWAQDAEKWNGKKHKEEQGSESVVRI